MTRFAARPHPAPLPPRLVDAQEGAGKGSGAATAIRGRVRRCLACHSPAPSPAVNQWRVSPYEMTRPNLRRGPVAGANLGSSCDLCRSSCYHRGSCSRVWCRQELAGAWCGQQSVIQGILYHGAESCPLPLLHGRRPNPLPSPLPASLFLTQNTAEEGLPPAAGPAVLRNVTPCHRRGQSSPCIRHALLTTLGSCRCGARGGGDNNPLSCACLVPCQDIPGGDTR